MYKDFPFHCPTCGSFSTPMTGTVGTETFTKFVCIRCSNHRTSASLAPTNPKSAITPTNSRVNQILSSSFLVMKNAAKTAGQNLSALKDSTDLPGDVRMKMAIKAPSVEEEARSLIRGARTNARDQLKPFVAPTQPRHTFNEKGYPITMAEHAEEVNFLETVTMYYFELVGKHFLEAGWGSLRISKNEVVAHHLVRLSCAACSQTTYAWTSAPNRESMRTEENLCSKCLDIHIDEFCAKFLR